MIVLQGQMIVMEHLGLDTILVVHLGQLPKVGVNQTLKLIMEDVLPSVGCATLVQLWNVGQIQIDKAGKL